MSAGQHVRVKRLGYFHHGIDCGDGYVIHYSGQVKSQQGACVQRTSMKEFSEGGSIEVVSYSNCRPPAEVVERACSRLGEAKYDLVFNNCEHFARWCKTGQHSSEQVRDTVATTGGAAGAAAATAGAIGSVAAGGAVAGLSGAGTMSGLAAAGGVVGGGAVAGLALLGVAPAAASVIAMREVLKDDPCLSQGERDARAIGRAGTVAGAAVGTAGAIGAVSAAGSVAGLSGAGITSGLAAIGGTVGGGMVAGTVLTIAFPAVAAAGIGYLAYRCFRCLV